MLVLKYNMFGNLNICVKEEKRCLKYNIIHYDEPIGFQDKILRRLEELVIDILNIEITK